MTTSVLIVEDEPSILELISYTCRTSGMEVRKAANVAEAKKNLEAAKPDIILLDWMLPDCAGLEWAVRTSALPQQRKFARYHADCPRTGRRQGSRFRSGGRRLCN